MSLEQAVFAAIHTTLTGDATLNTAKIIKQSVHRFQTGRPARVTPYIEIDVTGNSMDGISSGTLTEFDEARIRVRIVTDAHDGIGSGDTPEGAAAIDTISDRVNALLQGYTTAVSGFLYTTMRRTRRYPIAASRDQLIRVIDFSAVFGG
jgi:hypothetical protein